MFKIIRASGDDLASALCSASCIHAGPARAALGLRSTLLRLVLCTGLALAALTVTAAAANAATLVVDKDGQQCRNADYTTISAAVADADPGDRIEVCPDLYTESVVAGPRT